MAAELQQYWSGSVLAANLFIGANLVGAVLLGMLVGYERSYQGRAAGMRTYGLVCMASTAATVIVGFPGLWYGASVWKFAAVPVERSRAMSPAQLAEGLSTLEGIASFGIVPVRN